MMAFIDLTDLKCQLAEPAMPDYGSLQTPILGGGKISKVDRIGGGYLLKYTLPPERMEPNGRNIVARCQMAKRQGAIFEVPQVEFSIGTPGTGATVFGAIAGGMTLPITGAAPGYVVRQFQALNITRNGHRYLYFAAQNTTLDGVGSGTIYLTSPLRSKLLGGEAVNLADPVIEGWIQGDNFSWPIDMQRTIGLTFDILERA